MEVQSSLKFITINNCPTTTAYWIAFIVSCPTEIQSFYSTNFFDSVIDFALYSAKLKTAFSTLELFRVSILQLIFVLTYREKANQYAFYQVQLDALPKLFLPQSVLDTAQELIQNHILS
jgi:hypothetical protein